MPDFTPDQIIETLDVIRGHSLTPTAEVPALYTTEATDLPDKLVHAVYYLTGTEAVWYLMELDRETGRAFGWVNLGDHDNAELGYFMLPELAELTVDAPGVPSPNLSLIVRRVLDWTPCPFSEVRA